MIRPSMPAPVRRSYREFTLNMLYLAANNLPVKQIASIMDVSPARVERVLACDRAKREVAELQFSLSGESPEKAFAKLVPETIAVQTAVMRDKNEKGAVRIMAARDIQDRALGKPKQQVDLVHKSTARQVLEAIQSQKSAPIETTSRPVTDAPALDSGTEVPMDFPDDPPAPSQPAVDDGQGARDAVDAWIKENL
jgi:hypothetical protein